jgi:hypothetical protein
LLRPQPDIPAASVVYFCSAAYTDFERRQMAALREELDKEYEARNGLVKEASTETAHTNLSSRNRT